MIVPIRAALPLDAVVTVRLALTRCEVATKHEAPHSARRYRASCLFEAGMVTTPSAMS